LKGRHWRQSPLDASPMPTSSTPGTGQPHGVQLAGVVVLDEVSIVDTRRRARLFTDAARSRTVLVLVGDPIST
jgi:hypothetical protein